MTNSQIYEKTASTFFISLKTLLISGFTLALVFIASILATYFSKVCTNCDKNLPTRCQEVYCRHTYDWEKSCSSLLTTSTSTTIRPETINYRLPTTIWPFRYELTIKPYFNTTTRPEYYDGLVKIYFNTTTDTTKFTIYSLGLEIDYASIQFEGLTNSFEWSYDNITSFLTIELTNEGVFKAGHNYTFYTAFKGFPLDNKVGFYRSSYVDSNGDTKWLLTSQLSYIEARKSFPCFDEPAFKAVFKIRIIHDATLYAMSNMPVKSKTNLTDWIVTEFDDTIKMSTYLVAILVSDFSCLHGAANMPLSGSVDFRVCARPTAYDELDYALDMTLTILPIWEAYFNYSFPLPKLDHSAVPTFKFAAMENWGLILYAEKYFLYNENTTQIEETNIVQSIAHEITHMWFGNLVTHEWWNDVFLKEGFANYYEYRGADLIKPHWRMMYQYHEYLLGIIEADSSNFIREITYEVSSPDEINSQLNGVITYGQGSATIKMVAYILGEDTFKRGLYNYFVEYQLRNADQYDLWRTLHRQAIQEEKLTDVNFIDVMATWTEQKGHPVVTVRRLGKNQIGIGQNRFVTDTTIPISDLRDTKWYIPFTYSIETVNSTSSFTNQVNETNLFEMFHFISPNISEEIITLSRDLGVDDFIIANLDMAGFYRVQYDYTDWRLITRQLLNHKDQLSARTRATLLSDVFSLSEANYISNVIGFELAKYLVHEFDFLPWSIFISRIKFFTDLFASTSNYHKIQAFLRGLVKPYYTKLGWIENIPSDLWNDRMIRTNLVRFACRTDLFECTNEANQYFKSWISIGNSANIPKGLRQLVICTGVNTGNESDFKHVFTQMKSTNDPVLKNDLITGLACSKDPLLQLRLLDDLLKESFDVLVSALSSVANQPGGFVTSWTYLKANWEYLYSDSNDLTKLLKDISTKMKYNYEVKDIKNFFDSKILTKSLRDAVDEATSKIQSNIKWFSMNSQTILSWLDNNKLYS